jgi:hypothetical protein
MIRFGEFVLHNGKNNQGIQIVDSARMQELWTDQTNHAFQIASPYPNQPVNNNPYGADTIYYGLGSWLDIWNPTQHYQEQISADGAFGGIIWINRCTNMVGAFLTFIPSIYSTTNPIEYQAMDIFRNAVPSTCYTTNQVNEAGNLNSIINISPNPSQSTITISADKTLQKISIFNIRGENILNLFPERKETSVETSNISNGIYFIKAVIDKNTITKKIIIAH